MEQIKLMCMIQVLPFQPNGPEGDDSESKQLVFTDNDTGKVIAYPMGEELVQSVVRKLRMKNVALQDHLQQEAAKQAARQQVLGPNGGPIDAGA